jgi:hypothetical protein
MTKPLRAAGAMCPHVCHPEPNGKYPLPIAMVFFLALLNHPLGRRLAVG